jgi:hypothetical protein
MKTHFFGAACACAFTLVSLSSHAALIDRGGGLIYDDDLNVTWLADANYARTSGYDADGLMTWSSAMTWAGNLSYGGYTDWRLPTSDTCSGFNCTGSEMGHLFYIELGGTASTSILNSSDPDLTLFTNVQPANYWSGSEYALDPNGAWGFVFGNGGQSPGGKQANGYAWAVRPGDVATVPLPGAAWLFGSGLLGLLGMARRKAA